MTPIHLHPSFLHHCVVVSTVRVKDVLFIVDKGQYLHSIVG